MSFFLDVSPSWTPNDMLHACSVTQSYRTPQPHGLQPTRLLCPWNFLGKYTWSGLEWVAISYSRWSSQSRDWTCDSCIGRQILYQWDTWEAPNDVLDYFILSYILKALFSCSLSLSFFFFLLFWLLLFKFEKFICPIFKHTDHWFFSLLYAVCW